jgi:esterase/lipase superfamily enzyme
LRLRWLLLLVVALAAAVVAFFVFYHPPMRLMPPPLLFQDPATRVDLLGQAPEDSRLAVFFATNRLPVGPRESRIYTVAPDRNLHFGEAQLRIGGEDTTWEQLYFWSRGIEDDASRPFIHLEAMQEQATLPRGAAPDAATQAWLAKIEAALQGRADRDVIVYVHGANTTVERAAGQAAQLQHFTGRHGVVVLFAWPTAENFLRYSRDIESALGGAPHLADLIELLAKGTSAKAIDVMTYSAGATIGSAALAELGHGRPEIADRVGEVYHAAPDADFRGFVADLGAYAPHARRVTTALNMNDSALRLAGIVNRASRAGRPDQRDLGDDEMAWLLDAARAGMLQVLQVRPDEMPNTAATSHTFWYDDPWVSNDLIVTLLFHLAPPERGLREGGPEQPYWVFPPDYPDKMPALRDRLQAEIASRR